MVKIKSDAVKGFIQPIGSEHFEVSLFIVSPKNHRLKKLNLEKLSLEERSEKLKKYGKEHRFVAVIEIGDQIFAHVHASHAKELQNQDQLVLKGKKVTVNSLSEKEADQLAAVGEAFEQFMIEGEEKTEKEEKDKEKEKELSIIRHFIPTQHFAHRTLISDQTHMHFLIDQMVKCNLGKIIIRCMQKYNEDKRLEDQRKKANDEYFDTRRSEIKKEILTSEIKQAEIKQAEIKRTLK